MLTGTPNYEFSTKIEIWCSISLIKALGWIVNRQIHATNVSFCSVLIFSFAFANFNQILYLLKHWIFMAKFAVCLSAAAAIMSNVDQDGALLSHNRMCDILCFVFYILYLVFWILGFCICIFVFICCILCLFLLINTQLTKIRVSTRRL